MITREFVAQNTGPVADVACAVARQCAGDVLCVNGLFFELLVKESDSPTVKWIKGDRGEGGSLYVLRGEEWLRVAHEGELDAQRDREALILRCRHEERAP